jgi:hypothetical protein
VYDADRESWIERARAIPVLDEVARRGIKLKRVGVERVGPCPLCGGRDRFAVNPKKAIWNCRGCGTGGDVIELVRHLDDLTFTAAVELLAGPPPKKANSKHHGAVPKQTIAGAYPYHDEAGTVLLVVERHHYRNADGTFVLKDGKHQKTFKQKRPDPDRRGKWINNAEGVPVVPYRLPDVIAAIANGHPVAIVEGEAKADLLLSWGIAATCNAGGANPDGSWRAALGAVLGSDSFTDRGGPSFDPETATSGPGLGQVRTGHDEADRHLALMSEAIAHVDQKKRS